VGTWVTRVCTVFNQFSAANKQAGVPLSGLALEFKYGIPTETSTRAIQVKATAGFAANAEAALRSVAVAGTPSVDHGGQLEAGFVAALVTVRDAVTNVHRQASALPQGSARAPNSALLVGQLRTVFTHFGQQLTQVRDQYDTPALATAFRTQPACG